MLLHCSVKKLSSLYVSLTTSVIKWLIENVLTDNWMQLEGRSSFIWCAAYPHSLLKFKCGSHCFSQMIRPLAPPNECIYTRWIDTGHIALLNDQNALIRWTLTSFIQRGVIRAHTSFSRALYPHKVLTTSECCNTQTNAVVNIFYKKKSKTPRCIQ